MMRDRTMRDNNDKTQDDRMMRKTKTMTTNTTSMTSTTMMTMMTTTMRDKDKDNESQR